MINNKIKIIIIIIVVVLFLAITCNHDEKETMNICKKYKNYYNTDVYNKAYYFNDMGNKKIIHNLKCKKMIPYSCKPYDPYNLHKNLEPDFWKSLCSSYNEGQKIWCDGTDTIHTFYVTSPSSYVKYYPDNLISPNSVYEYDYLDDCDIYKVRNYDNGISVNGPPGTNTFTH